ncbi:DMT family transporter [Gordonia sp. HY002]|uniref:DMT family transporter n=1 Tax=Gordonia zhenghanii TaxID=2911516 RepID=UPI001EF11A64|nr:DMT family transporter [Gordonia zhenghanii]MCF8569847.1 DMT family transporter [Gordonia zhenghanii]MCF8602469.1 DMT family transporter [Gordonia zhenghanii]
MNVLAVVLALVAALLFAVAAVLQEKGTDGLSDDDAAGVGVGLFAKLVRRRVWLLGITADIAGFAVQAGALAVGSLLLVQPLLVSTLLFALPLAAFVQRRRLTGAEWLWATVLIVALVLFMVFGEPSEGITAPSFASWIAPLIFLVVVVSACVLGGSRLPHGTNRSLILAVAAGLMLGFSAPFTKTVVDAFGESFFHGLSSWEFWAMAVTATLGTLWQQSSYQAGDVQTSLPTVTVLKPMIAMGLGLSIYHEHLRISTFGDFVVVASLAFMCVATFALGRLSAPPQPAETASASGSSPRPGQEGSKQ